MIFTPPNTRLVKLPDHPQRARRKSMVSAVGPLQQFVEDLKTFHIWDGRTP